MCFDIICGMDEFINARSKVVTGLAATSYDNGADNIGIDIEEVNNEMDLDMLIRRYVALGAAVGMYVHVCML